MSDYLSATAKNHQVTLELKKANDMLNVFEREKIIILEKVNADKTEIDSLKKENMSLKRQIAGKDEIKRSTLISSLKESLNAALEEIIVLQSRLAEPHQLKGDSPGDSDTKSDVVVSLKEKIDELNVESIRYIDSASLSSSLSSKLEIAQNQNEENKNQIKSFEEEISSLKSEAVSSRTELSELEKKMDIQTKALQLKENQHIELQKQHEAVEAALVLAKNNYDSSKAENVSLQKDLLAVKSTLESNTELIKKQDEIIVNSKKEIDDLKNKLKNHSDSVTLVNSLQNSLKTIELENKQMLNKSKTFEEEITTLKGKVNSSQAELSEVKKKMDIQTNALKLKENEHSALEVKHREAISKIQHLESELATGKAAQKSGEDNIRNLQKDKLHLQARLNQIQSSSYNSPPVKRSHPESSSQSSTSSSSKTKRKKDDCSIFEVEKLIDHKIENGKLFYKVRWMSYGPEDDTWECESNLNCPDILSDYKKKQSFK